MDKRQQINSKVQELEATKQELDEKGQELNSQATQQEEPMQEPIVQDNRQTVANMVQQLQGMQQQLQAGGQSLAQKTSGGYSDEGATTSKQPREAITKERLDEFNSILMKYKECKANLDNRVIDNQEWWKLRHYGQHNTKSGTNKAADKKQKQTNEPKSVTAWTLNSILNKHADFMDNIPSASCLPVEEQDVEYAKKLSSVLPVVMDRANYDRVFNDTGWDILIAGTKIEHPYWDSDANNGLGEIAISSESILECHWEPGISNIQDSEYFFNTKLISNNKIKNMFPTIEGLDKALSGNPSMSISKFKYDDYVDTTNYSLVIDVYYHKLNSAGKSVLHYCKYVNDVVLFASENMEQFDETGYYAHNMYPFEFTPLFPVEGSPCGFGYVDVCKQIQSDIDELNDDLMRNAKTGTRRKYIVANSTAINEDELTDDDNQVVHSNGSLDDGNYKEVQHVPLDSMYVNLLEMRINELKEVSNNRDVNSGGTTGGATAASAVAAMQEMGTKTSRDQESALYRGFKSICQMVIELMGQFYTEDRYFRITGDNGEQQYISLNNSGIASQTVQGLDGNEYSRKPIYDIKVKPQKRSQYSDIANNELIMQLYAGGIFNPQNAPQAAMVVRFMEFEGKDRLLQAINENGSLYQLLLQAQQTALQLASELDSYDNGERAEQIAMAMEQNAPLQIGAPGQTITKPNLDGGTKNTIAENASNAAQQRSEVR